MNRTNIEYSHPCLFRSVLAVLLLGGGNLLSKKLTGNGLF